MLVRDLVHACGKVIPERAADHLELDRLRELALDDLGRGSVRRSAPVPETSPAPRPGPTSIAVWLDGPALDPLLEQISDERLGDAGSEHAACFLERACHGAQGGLPAKTLDPKPDAK